MPETRKMVSQKSKTKAKHPLMEGSGSLLSGLGRVGVPLRLYLSSVA